MKIFEPNRFGCKKPRKLELLNEVYDRENSHCPKCKAGVPYTLFVREGELTKTEHCEMKAFDQDVFALACGSCEYEWAVHTERDEDIENSGLNPSEAIMAFLGWLTTRRGKVSFGETEECSVAVELFTEFTEHNKMPEIRENYTNHFSMPIKEGFCECSDYSESKLLSKIGRCVYCSKIIEKL